MFEASPDCTDPRHFVQGATGKCVVINDTYPLLRTEPIVGIPLDPFARSYCYHRVGSFLSRAYDLCGHTPANEGGMVRRIYCRCPGGHPCKIPLKHDSTKSRRQETESRTRRLH